MSRRVLLINPAKQDNIYNGRLHMGLSLIGQILTSNGHDVRIMDYAFLRDLDGKIKVPNAEEVIHEFEPDVIGISVFSYLYDENQRLIDEISKCSNAPIILGGPHITLFPEDFVKDKRVSYIVRGEAESIILELITNAERKQPPVIINCPTPSADEIPAVNLDIALGSQYLEIYQIQLSRGCPFNCSFCSIDLIAGRQVRARNLDQCLEQITEAKKRYPDIKIVTITDDLPTFKKDRFKEFLIKFAESNFNCLLTVDNMRADMIEEEILQLYIKANGHNICLGVESGHPEVFKLVNKGESLNQIIDAAKLVHKHGLQLGLCFVIGLPEDTLKKHKHSVSLAKALKPDYVYWNMCIPWPGTEVHRWYEKNGKIGDLRNFSTIIDTQVNYKIPPVSSPDFPIEDRIKAWLMANMETYIFELSGTSIKKLILETLKYKLYRSFTIYLTGKVLRSIKIRLSQMRRYLKQFGIHFIILKLARKIRKNAIERILYGKG